MIVALKFFVNNLKWHQIIFFGIFLFLHISSHIWHLDADKHLIKSVPNILKNPDDNEFLQELSSILLQNMQYLILYMITMFIIEMISKLAIRNANNKISKKLLKADLSKISKKQHEHDITSIVHHSENVSSAIHNLFIEFPRKIVACHHFMIALRELSFEIMLYCTITNLLFVSLTIGISFIRKYLSSKIVETNINSSVICSDISNSIQTYKIDDRTKEYQNKINNLTYSVWYNSSLDALMVASNDALTSLSSQLMIGLISYICRPIVLTDSITIEDLMYGVKSSSKFVEKLIGVLEYIGNVIRQYKSFNFFVSTSSTIVEESKNLLDDIKIIQINTKNSTGIRTINKKGQIIRIIGPNGVGKTTLSLNFLGISYKNATSTGNMQAFNITNDYLLPSAYRKSIAFVQQNIPLTYDSICEYIAAVSKINEDPYTLLCRTLDYFKIKNNTKTKILEFIESLDMNKSMRELSGGQSKFIQILASIIKLYVQRGNILILDEPSNNLDIDKISYIKKIFKSCISKNIIIILVTHDDRIISTMEHDVIEL